MTQIFKCGTFLLTLLLLLCIIPKTVSAQQHSLRTTLEQIIQPLDATIGVAIMNLEDKDALTINGDHRYPMQSVFKFPLAMAVLHQIDQGRLSLDQQIHLTKEDMMQNTWSPLTEKYPEGNVDLPLSDILKYTVAESDNSGCDILFRLIGGPQIVQKYIHSLGVKDIAIVATEKNMHQDQDMQFSNWARPEAMVQLLNIAFKTDELSENSRAFLWKTMAESSPGAKRIKGKLPEGTEVGHKTGTGSVNKGVQSASNDIGIVTLPDGQQFAIAVLISRSKQAPETNEATIAEIARAAYDHYLARGK